MPLCLRWGTVTIRERHAPPARRRRGSVHRLSTAHGTGGGGRHGARQQRAVELGWASGGFDVLYANLTRGLNSLAENAHGFGHPLHAGPARDAVRGGGRGGRRRTGTDRRRPRRVPASTASSPPCARRSQGVESGVRAAAGGALPVSLSDTVRAPEGTDAVDSAIAVAPCVDGDSLQCTTAAGALDPRRGSRRRGLPRGIGPGIVVHGVALGPRRARSRGRGERGASALRWAADRRPEGLARRHATPAPRPVAPHASALALCLGSVRVAWPRVGSGSAIRRRRGRGRRHRLGSRVRAPATRPHGARAGEDPRFFAGLYAAGALAAA